MFVDAVSGFYFECDFQVMIQPHNRHMSFSVYICVLSVADTVSLIIGRYVLLVALFGGLCFWNQVLWICYWCKMIIVSVWLINILTLSVADPGFSPGGRQLPKLLLFFTFLPKTA